MFGASPIYLLARILSRSPDTAFQIWYLFGYLANFLAAYYALKKLGNSWLASAVGALIFSFALPVTVKSNHAQLHYRFGVPIAITMFILFLQNKDWRRFILAAAWLVWQFYCTIYIGFFALLMLATILIIYLFYSACTKVATIRHIVSEFAFSWSDQPLRMKRKYLLALTSLFCLLIILFYPYMIVSHLYSASRSLHEIASMLPRPQSYFLSDTSWLWSSQSKFFANIPMRQEHQMFIGAVPMFLAFMGYIFGSKDKNGIAFILISFSLAALIIITLYLGGFSLWYLIAKLPLASAIRAITRIVLVFLFPAAYLAAVAIDHICSFPHSKWMKKIIYLIIIPAMIFEFSAISAPLSAKKEWRQRLTEKEAVFPKQLPNKSIIFFAQSGKDQFFTNELDAMWVALMHGAKTLNGYSGLLPPGFNLKYGDDCKELPRRISSYLSFSGHRNNKEAFLSLIKRVIPIGFQGCDKSWMTVPPLFTTTHQEYTAKEIRNLSFKFLSKTKLSG